MDRNFSNLSVMIYLNKIILIIKKLILNDVNSIILQPDNNCRSEN